MLSPQHGPYEDRSSSSRCPFQPQRGIRVSILLISATLFVNGCVYTHARVTSQVQPTHVASRIEPKSANILITDSGAVGRDYVELGSIEAIALSVNLLSSLPTRADVDEALRR